MVYHSRLPTAGSGGDRLRFQARRESVVCSGLCQRRASGSFAWHHAPFPGETEDVLHQLSRRRCRHRPNRHRCASCATLSSARPVISTRGQRLQEWAV